jgi:hypothetical protein
MDAARRFLLTTMTLAAGLGVAGVALANRESTSAQGSPGRSVATMTAATAPVRGLVIARSSGAGRARVYVSLHGLQPRTAYLVVENTRRCSRIVDAADYVIWRLLVRSTGGGQTFEGATVARHGALTSVRSVRVYEVRATGRPVQRACVLSGTYDSSTGVLT